jgi:hypothetical protein
MRPPDALLVEVPLEASIPNFYDADIDLDLTIALAAVSQPDGQRVLRVHAARGRRGRDLPPGEHIFSGGAATAAQAMLQPLAADLIKAFLGPQIEAQVRAALQPVVDIMLSGMAATDPAHRTYKLYAIEAAPLDLVIVGAPAPWFVPPPVLNPNRRRRAERSARDSRPPRHGPAARVRKAKAEDVGTGGLTERTAALDPDPSWPRSEPVSSLIRAPGPEGGHPE